MPYNENTNWGQSVTGVVIRNNDVLLVRHTYETGDEKLIVPGGYVCLDETPQDAVRREILEKAGLIVMPKDVIGVRFNAKDWNVAFSAECIDGFPITDEKEYGDVVWMDIHEALLCEDVPEFSKKLILSVCNGKKNLKYTSYEGNKEFAPYSLYC